MKNRKILFSILISIALVFICAAGVNTGVVFAESATISHNKMVTATELPTAYNNDYTNLNYITSVKNQESFGMCWAFSVVSCAESDAIKNHGASLDLNLSEWHLGYFLYHGEREGTNDEVLPGNLPYYNCGGNEMFASFVLSSWIGFANEEVAPYSTLVANPSATISSSKMHENAYLVDNVYTYDSSAISDVKEAILTYGSAITSYYSSTRYLNTTNYAQYCSRSNSSDHSVTVVGWDDNYPKQNFTTVYGGTPTNNGAWLIKNSWGSDWGLNGYFWLSYEDVTIEYFAAVDVVPSSSYDNLYQHDGGVSPKYYSTSLSPMANVFTSEKDELLTHVGITTYDTDIVQSSYDYTIKIYKNPSSLDASKSGFTFNNLVYSQTGSIPAAGYSNIKLTTGVPLKQNDVFVISVDSEAPIGTDSYWTETSGSNTITTSNAKVLKNQTYYYHSSENKWYDAGDDDLTICNSIFNARIKAITSFGEAELEVAPTMETLKYGKTLSQANLVGGVVSNTLTGLEIDGVWSFVEPNKVPVNGEVVQVKFTPTASYYSEITTTVVTSVEQTEVLINVSTQKTTYAANEQVNLSVSITNPYNGLLSDFGVCTITYSVMGESEQVVSNNSFIIPSTVSGGDEIIIKVKSLAVENKYFETTETYTISVCFELELSELPVVTPVEYGNALSCSSLTGGVIVDAYSKTQLQGEWSFVFPTIVPQGTTSQLIKFVPSNSNYEEFNTTILVNVIPATITIELTLSNYEFNVGDHVDVTVTITNNNNSAFHDFGNVTLYYLLNNENKTLINGTSFVVTNEMAGKTISVVAEVAEVSGKYLQTESSVTAEVLEVELDEPTNDDTQTDIPNLDNGENNSESDSNNNSNNNNQNGGSNNSTNNNEQEQNGNSEEKIDFKIAIIVVGVVFGVPILCMIISLIVKRKRY